MTDEVETFVPPPGYSDVVDHQANFFNAVRSRKPCVENEVFGNNAAIGCHLANYAYFNKKIATWDAVGEEDHELARPFANRSELRVGRRLPTRSSGTQALTALRSPQLSAKLGMPARPAEPSKSGMWSNGSGHMASNHEIRVRFSASPPDFSRLR